MNLAIRRSGETEHRHQRLVDRPHLVRVELADALAEPLLVDRTELFHEHSAVAPRDPHGRPERRGPSAPRGRGDEYHASSELRIASDWLSPDASSARSAWSASSSSRTEIARAMEVGMTDRDRGGGLAMTSICEAVVVISCQADGPAASGGSGHD